MTDKANDTQNAAPGSTGGTAPASKPDPRLDDILNLLRKPVEPDARLDEVLELLTKPASASEPDTRLDERLDQLEALLMVVARHVTGNLTAETPEDILA